MVPHSENAQEVLYGSLREYNKLINKVKQYPYDENTKTGYPADDLGKFYDAIGINEEEEARLTTNISNELKEILAKKDNIDISMIDLDMEHVTYVIINYDYLVELIAQMANEVNDNQMTIAEKTYEFIQNELNKLESDIERVRMQRFIDRIFKKEYSFDEYPVDSNYEDITKALEESEKEVNYKNISKFIYEWGIGNAISPRQLFSLIKKHRKGQNDLDNQGEVRSILISVKDDYKDYAIEKYANLNWINYRNEFRDSIYELAEKMKELE